MVDITHPKTPVSLSNLSTEESVLNISVSNGFVFVNGFSSRENGFDSIAIIDQTSLLFQPPVEINRIKTAGKASAVVVIDNIVYLADGPNGFQVVYVSNPHTPVLIGQTNISGNSLDLEIVGNSVAGSGNFHQ